MEYLHIKLEIFHTEIPRSDKLGQINTHICLCTYFVMLSNILEEIKINDISFR